MICIVIFSRIVQNKVLETWNFRRKKIFWLDCCRNLNATPHVSTSAWRTQDAHKLSLWRHQLNCTSIRITNSNWPRNRCPNICDPTNSVRKKINFIFSISLEMSQSRLWSANEICWAKSRRASKHGTNSCCVCRIEWLRRNLKRSLDAECFSNS